MKYRMFFLAVLSASPVIAKGPPRDMVEMKAGTPVSIQKDRSYLLFRVPKHHGVPNFEPVFLRIPNAEEMKLYEADRAASFALAAPKLIAERDKQLSKQAAVRAAGGTYSGIVPPAPTTQNFNYTWTRIGNLQNIDAAAAFAKSAEEATYLVEVKPGDYVLFGASWPSGLASVHVCFCLGTVGFAAEPGKVVDLGYFMADRAKEKSVIPELASETGYGPSSDPGGTYLLAGTVRAVGPESSRAAGVPRDAVEPARYRAVGKYLYPGAVGINRLVPVPGILDYDGGAVIDVQSGKQVPDNF